VGGVKREAPAQAELRPTCAGAKETLINDIECPIRLISFVAFLDKQRSPDI
jgi:hypothetical protein